MHWLDPDFLPATTGTVATVLFNQHGDPDGWLLSDGGQSQVQVHVPPHLGRRLLRAVRVGERITVRGVRPRGAPVLVALRVVNAAGKAFDDEGPDGAGPPVEPTTRPVHVRGRVTSTLHAPRGELVGAVLDGGEQVRTWPKGNEWLVDYLQPGLLVDVWGDAFKKQGTVVVSLGEVALAENSDD